jgi:hypothetical protein
VIHSCHVVWMPCCVDGSCCPSLSFLPFPPCHTSTPSSSSSRMEDVVLPGHTAAVSQGTPAAASAEAAAYQWPGVAGRNDDGSRGCGGGEEQQGESRVEGAEDEAEGGALLASGGLQR